MPDKGQFLNSSDTKIYMDRNHNDNLIAEYKEWFVGNSIACKEKESYQKITYIDAVLKPVFIQKQKIEIFAPFQNQFSAFKTFTWKQCIFIAAILLAAVFGGILNSNATFIFISLLASCIYIAHFLFILLFSMKSLIKSPEEKIDDKIVHALSDVEWPNYTVLCPLYREVKIVPQFVEAMRKLDYPTDKLQILFLIEEDDEATRIRIQEMNLPHYFCVITVPDGQPRTKPRACNFGLLQATGEYIVIYDAEDIPDPLQLKKAVLTFAKHDSTVTCVQAKLNFYNRNQNILTRWFTVEYSLLFDLTLPGLQEANLSIPLGGTSNHFRTEKLCEVGAWDAFNVTEDCDLGIRLAHRHLKTVMLDSTTYEEANSHLKNWLRQRSRWIKGYMQTYLVYMREPLQYLYQKRFREFFSLQLMIGGKVMAHFVSLIIWMFLVSSVLYHLLLRNPFNFFFPGTIIYVCIIGLILGNVLYMCSYLIGCIGRRQYSLIIWALLIPIYGGLISIATLIALYQLICKPHYWEKTHHGLHL